MRNFWISLLSRYRFIPLFAGLLLVSGILLWLLARLATSSSPDATMGEGSATHWVLATIVWLMALVVTALFIQRYFTRPIHQLVDYVKRQHDDADLLPPTALLDRRDDLALLTVEIQHLLETLRAQNDKLLEQTLNDPLTGLGNRRLLDQRLDTALPLSRRRMAPLSALMIDVDHFKDYNDHYGHPAGDECLVEIANVLRDTFRRETDIVVRLGGEEFLVVMLDVDTDEAMRMAEAMRSMLQAVGIPHEKSSAAHVVTVSIGVATAKPGTPIDVDQLLSSADSALYQCKAKGRNCSVSCVLEPDLQAQTDALLSELTNSPQTDASH